MAKPSNSTKIKYVADHPDGSEYHGEFNTLEEAIKYIEEDHDKQYWDDFVIYEVTREFNYKPPTDITYNWVEV